MTNQTETREIRVMKLDEALELMRFAQRHYGEHKNWAARCLFLDTPNLTKREDISNLDAESDKQDQIFGQHPQIVGDFYAVRKLNEGLLEASKILSFNLGHFYEPLTALFNNGGFLKKWSRLKAALEDRSKNFRELKQIRLEEGIVSKEDASYFIGDPSREAYAKNRGWDGTNKRLADISVELPTSKNWTLGSFALLPKAPYTATISEASPEQQIVMEYSGEPLEIALLRDYTRIAETGRGIISMEKDKIPLYLRRRLGLGESK